MFPWCPLGEFEVMVEILGSQALLELEPRQAAIVYFQKVLKPLRDSLRMGNLPFLFFLLWALIT